MSETKIQAGRIDQTIEFDFSEIATNDGTAALPAYSFTSGQNMGMYRSGTNQLSFSTTSAEALRISSDNHVRVMGANTSTNSTAGTLLIANGGATNNHIIRFSGNSGSFDNLIYTPASSSDIRIARTDGTTTTDLFTFSQGAILTYSSSGGSGLRVYGAAGTHQWDMYLNGTDLRFSDNTTGGKVQIDNNLNVSAQISVAGAAFKTSLNIGGTGTSAPASSGTTPAAGTVMRLQGNSNAILDFGSNSSTYAWIQSTDQTGLGTSYPLALNPNGGQVLHPDGNLSNPGIAFANQTGVGIYRAGSNNMQLVAGGTSYLQMSGTVLQPLVQTGNIDGTAATPSYSFSGDGDTGFYRFGSGQVSLASNGFEAIRFGAPTTADGSIQQLQRMSYGGNSVAASITGQTTTGVTTTGSYIGGVSAGLVLVTGNDAGGNDFVDLVLTSYNSGTALVIAQLTHQFSPSSRSYTSDGTGLKLTMGSGTYKIVTLQIDSGFR